MMHNQTAMTKILDWFVPVAARPMSEVKLIRSFVFLHLFGPLMAQSIGIFLYMADPAPGVTFWVVEGSICAFWLLPLLLRVSGNLQLTAYISVQMLTFVTLYGSFFYGGMSSPFVPWLLIALLLGFFYLAGNYRLLLGSLGAQCFCFLVAYIWHGRFLTRVPLDELSEMNLISVFSATVYMSWMAIYYADVVADREDIEKEAELHRQTTEKLREAMMLAEKANRAKSIFLAKMSHELRTPLNAVIGYSELLLEDAQTSKASGQKLADLKRINGAGRHLLSLVTDVLDLSRIEANLIDLRVEAIDLDDLIEDVISTSQPLIESQGNRLVLNRAEDLGVMINDPLKLRQALLNLLSNAAKFTRNGTVTLSVQPDPEEEVIEFVLSDTGVGIAPADLPLLFQDFAQGSNATARNFGGTGLGLVLTRRFCELMGGTVSVRSKLGRGSTFTIRVPRTIPFIPHDHPSMKGTLVAA